MVNNISWNNKYILCMTNIEIYYYQKSIIKTYYMIKW